MAEGNKNDEGKMKPMFMYWEPYVNMYFPSLTEVARLYDDLVSVLISSNESKGCIAILIQQLIKEIRFYPEALSQVSKCGIKNHGLNNYKKGLEWSRLLNAFCRHMYKFINGERIDDESGEDHRVHMVANLLMLWYNIQNHPELNDIRKEAGVEDE